MEMSLTAHDERRDPHEALAPAVRTDDGRADLAVSGIQKPMPARRTDVHGLKLQTRGVRRAARGTGGRGMGIVGADDSIG